MNYTEANYPTVDTTFTHSFNYHWNMDSGASSHVTGERAILESMNENHPDYSVTTANRVSHHISGNRSTNVHFASRTRINLNHILYVLALRHNLISVGSLANDDLSVVFTGQRCLVLDKDTNHTILAVGERDSQIDCINFSRL